MLYSLFIRKNNRTGIQRRFTPLLILLLCLVTTAACGGQAPEARNQITAEPIQTNWRLTLNQISILANRRR
jgi:hypothetical protein